MVGGSCNDYDYACQDPLNTFDLDGRMIPLAIEAGDAIFVAGGAALAYFGLIKNRPPMYVPHMGNPFSCHCSHAGQTWVGTGARGGHWVDNNTMYATHRKGARKSTQAKHQKGDARRGTDGGGERGDARRRGGGVNPNKFGNPKYRD